MRLHFVILTTACLLPQITAADQLERMESAAEAWMARMTAFMVGRLPELEGKMPFAEWTDEDRVIAQCMIERLATVQGPETAEAYVAAMEAWGQVEITSMTQMETEMPPELAEGYLYYIEIACGKTDREAALMDFSGMMAVIQDPANMELLMAE